MAALLPVAPAPAAPACDARPSPGLIVTLCRVTVLSGRGPGFVLVRLTREAIPVEDFTTVGAGRFTGFAFGPDTSKPSSGDPIVIGGRLEASPKDRAFICCSDADVIRPGVYRLYLLGWGRARVVLRLDGLAPGTTRLTPNVPVDAEMSLLRPTLVGGASANYYAAGALGHVRSDYGLGFSGVWADASPHVVSSIGTCLYFGDVPDEPAFAPGCPWAVADRSTGQVNGIRPDTDEVTVALYGITRPLPRGSYDQGVYLATASIPRQLDAFALWLGFGPPSLAGHP
jgi:hypothetical protein